MDNNEEKPKRHSKGSSGGSKSKRHSKGSSGGSKSKRHSKGSSGGSKSKRHSKGSSGGSKKRGKSKRHSIASSGTSGSGKSSDKGSKGSKGSKRKTKPKPGGTEDKEGDGRDGIHTQNAAGTAENADRNLPFLRPTKVAPAPTPPPVSQETDNSHKLDENRMTSMYTPSVIDVLHFLPPEAIKTIKIKHKPLRGKPRLIETDKPRGPVAAKVVFLKKPEVPEESLEDEEEEEELPPGDFEPFLQSPKVLSEPKVEEPEEETPAKKHEKKPTPLLLFVDDVDKMLKENNEDKEIENRLNRLMDAHRGEKLRKLKNTSKARIPNLKFEDMIRTLNKMGIPCPTNEDFARLHGLHSRWDPDGTVIEYFSPVLRSFIPINMRGRYRGSWPTDTCMKGLNISKVSPKRDALEGFVERGRHANIQEKYDIMSEVAVDEAHLDYMIEMQAFQAETLPIPIFYDMLHLGMQVANQCLRILVQEEGYPPNNNIFQSQFEHAEQLRRKLQLYGALGLETLDSKRRGLGEYLPHWLKSRDEIIRDIMETKDEARYQNLEKSEVEARERERLRREQRTSVPITDRHSSTIATKKSVALSGDRTPSANPSSGLNRRISIAVAGAAKTWNRDKIFKAPPPKAKK